MMFYKPGSSGEVKNETVEQEGNETVEYEDIFSIGEQKECGYKLFFRSSAYVAGISLCGRLLCGDAGKRRQ